MPHVVLLGDSIFDNGVYVRGGPDVVTQLRPLLPDGWQATLAAVDGAVIGDVTRQLAAILPDATHLVISAGGNDALGHAGLLERRATSSAAVLSWFADASARFANDYRRMLAAVTARRLPTLVCTIYEGNLGPPTDRIAATALAIFNDVIQRVAGEHDVPVLELRRICTQPGDYANPIEPSVQGGGKIARAVAGRLVGELRSDSRMVG